MDLLEYFNSRGNAPVPLEAIPALDRIEAENERLDENITERVRQNIELTETTAELLAEVKRYRELVADTLAWCQLNEGIEISSPNLQDWRVAWWLSVAPFPNLLTDADADFESGVGAWVAETNCTLSAHAGYPSMNGTGTLQAEAIADGDLAFRSPAVAVEGRRTYRADVYIASLAGLGFSLKQSGAEIDWLDASSVVMSTIVGAVAFPGTGFSLRSVEGRAPSGAAYARIRVRVLDADQTVNSYFPQGHVVDAVTFARSE